MRTPAEQEQFLTEERFLLAKAIYISRLARVVHRFAVVYCPLVVEYPLRGSFRVFAVFIAPKL